MIPFKWRTMIEVRQPPPVRECGTQTKRNHSRNEMKKMFWIQNRKTQRTASTKVKIFRHDHIWNNDIISTFAASKRQPKVPRAEATKIWNALLVAAIRKFGDDARMKRKRFFDVDRSKKLHQSRQKWFSAQNASVKSIKLINCVKRPECNDENIYFYWMIFALSLSRRHKINACALCSAPIFVRAACISRKIMPTLSEYGIVAVARTYDRKNFIITFNVGNAFDNKNQKWVSEQYFYFINACVGVGAVLRAQYVTHVDHSRRKTQSNETENLKFEVNTNLKRRGEAVWECVNRRYKNMAFGWLLWYFTVPIATN